MSHREIPADPPIGSVVVAVYGVHQWLATLVGWAWWWNEGDVPAPVVSPKWDGDGWPVLESMGDDLEIYVDQCWRGHLCWSPDTVTPATPEELARYQLDQLGAEDAL